MTPIVPTSAPALDDCRVVEFRQYTLRPGQRDVLIELFDREFVESQEAVRMRVIGQFRDLDDRDRFVWLRGFADMAARARALQAFYGGPVWAAHRSVANATMVDSDNVLLLRAAWPGSGIRCTPARAPLGVTQAPRGVLRAIVLHLVQPASVELLDFCRERLGKLLRDGGALWHGWYVTEPAENDFPRLPVREGEHVLLALAMFADDAACERFVGGGAWEREAMPTLSRWFAAPAPALPLAPPARSALQAPALAPRDVQHGAAT
jgi:hypothetical protein